MHFGTAALFVFGVIAGLGNIGQCHGAETIHIQSAILRNRVVVLNEVVMKKALYVAFVVDTGATADRSLRVHGRIAQGNAVLSRASLPLTPERTGNLVFDLPYALPEGIYTISIQGHDENGIEVALGSRDFDRSALISSANARSALPDKPLKELPHRTGINRFPATQVDQSRGYVLFARSPFTYVYHDSVPDLHEVVRELSAQTARGATATMSLAVHPLRDLGGLRFIMSDLRSAGTALPRDRVRVACVTPVPDMNGAPQGTFRSLPSLLRPIPPQGDLPSHCRHLWITIRVDTDVPPGPYSGTLTIVPEHAERTTVPIRLVVAPIDLQDVPGVDYCMLMTYEFSEMTMPWSAKAKSEMRASAARVLKDYRDHGMTMLCPHSPFVMMMKDDGAPALDDILAALEAAREAGFTRPIVWYMGHLIQTAKPRHPANIHNFRQSTQIERLAQIVKTISEHARARGYPEIIFLPIDEPDDSYQDVNNRRNSVTPLLVRTIRESGAKSMVTSEHFDKSGQPDYLASSRLNSAERDRAHAMGARYWVYENRVAMECSNPVFARYVYGYFAWKNNLDGVSTWTFQNTQNAAGRPGLPNPPGSSGLDVYLAYPHPSGPLATLRWEAIRAGIEDRKLIHQLVDRVTRLKAQGMGVVEYERFLDGLKDLGREPCCDADACTIDEAPEFERRKNTLIEMIMNADRVRH